MQAKSEYRDRSEPEVEVLDALVDRAEEGMTVFELRAAVEADIDTLEHALANLKDDGLISVNSEEDRVVILPDDRVVPSPNEQPEPEYGFFEALREKFGF